MHRALAELHSLQAGKDLDPVLAFIEIRILSDIAAQRDEEPAYRAVIQKVDELAPRVQRAAAILYQKCFAYQQLEASADALKTCAEVTRHNENFESGYLAAAAAHRALGDTEKARALLTSLRGRYPKSAQVVYQLGILSLDEEQLESAEASLKQAVDLDPNHTNAQFWLGMTLYELNRYLEAEAPTRIVLERRASLPASRVSAAYWNLGRIMAAKREFRAAIQLATQSIELRPGSADGYVLRANSYSQSGNCRAAIPDYEKALEREPGCRHCAAFLTECRTMVAANAASGNPLTKELQTHWRLNPASAACAPAWRRVSPLDYIGDGPSGAAYARAQAQAEYVQRQVNAAAAERAAVCDRQRVQFFQDHFHKVLDLLSRDPGIRATQVDEVREVLSTGAFAGLFREYEAEHGTLH